MKRLISLWSDASSLNGAHRTIVAMACFLLWYERLDYSDRIQPKRITVKSLGYVDSRRDSAPGQRPDAPLPGRHGRAHRRLLPRLALGGRQEPRPRAAARHPRSADDRR